MSDRAEKIGIVGAGSVGATIAYACMVRGVGKHISLFDRVGTKVKAEVLDLNHGLMFVPMAKLDGSDDITVLEQSDVIVVTAGAKQKPGQTRIDLAETNTAICRELIPDLLRVAPDAKLLMVTNPVDVLTYVALKLSGLDSSKVLGSGTVLDSSRFRFLIAQRCAVAVQNVHAYIAGEHGDSQHRQCARARLAHARPPGDERAGREGDIRERAHLGREDHPGQGRYQLRDRLGCGCDSGSHSLE
jgi:L-lactate dehydrogenase